MGETPKLHGWITPEYAMQIVDELTEYLLSNGYRKRYKRGKKIVGEYHWYGLIPTEEWQDVTNL